MSASSKKLSQWLDSLASNESGNIAILAVLAAIPLLIAMGGAVDYAKAMANEQSLQNALDASVLAGVSAVLDPEDEISMAETYFEANYPDFAQVAEYLFSHQGEQLVGTASMDVDTAFLRIISMPTLAVEADAAATADMYREPMCVMAMHPHRMHTLELKGSVSVIGADCNFYGNSDNPDDVVDPHNATNFLTGQSVQAVGYGHHYIENVTPPLEHAPEVLADPLASMSIPTAGACNHTATVVVNGGTSTLSPGVYCKGITIKSRANVTLSPGVYFVKGNLFKVADSTLVGQGVTIVLADNHAKIDWAHSTIRLAAPKTGAHAGFVFKGARVAASHAINVATVDLHGVVYLPNGVFNWINAGTPTLTAKWTVWIVDGFTWDGSGVININFKPDESDVPYPAALHHVIPRPGTPRLVS